MRLAVSTMQLAIDAPASVNRAQQLAESDAPFVVETVFKAPKTNDETLWVGPYLNSDESATSIKNDGFPLEPGESIPLGGDMPLSRWSMTGKQGDKLAVLQTREWEPSS